MFRVDRLAVPISFALILLAILVLPQCSHALPIPQYETDVAVVEVTTIPGPSKPSSFFNMSSVRSGLERLGDHLRTGTQSVKEIAVVGFERMRTTASMITGRVLGTTTPAVETSTAGSISIIDSDQIIFENDPDERDSNIDVRSSSDGTTSTTVSPSSSTSGPDGDGAETTTPVVNLDDRSLFDVPDANCPKDKRRAKDGSCRDVVK